MAEFFYHCTQCGKKHDHNKGYIFTYLPDTLGRGHMSKLSSQLRRFCDIDCCDAWIVNWECNASEDTSLNEPRLILLPEKKINRREAVLATRKKYNA